MLLVRSVISKLTNFKMAAKCCLTSRLSSTVFIHLIHVLLICNYCYDFSCYATSIPRINAMFLDSSSTTLKMIGGSIQSTPLTTFTVNMVGVKLNDSEIFVSFSPTGKNYGEICSDDRITSVLKLSSISSDGLMGEVKLSFPEFSSSRTYYLCLKSSDTTGSSNSTTWLYQGDRKSLRIIVPAKGFEIPKWIRITLAILLMMLSGIFSGLNLGLMSLDPSDLKIVMNSGTAKEKSYASRILPIRRHGNFLLCTLLLGNTLVNSSFTILLDDLTSGIVAVIGSTAAIVIFGEIIPQSICSRYGLAVGSHTILLTKLFMVLTFPLSYPISKLLDCILGEEIGAVYNKSQLLEMLRVQSDYNDLEQDEVGIISGALKYKAKQVEEVMTPIDDCFLLDEDIVLDFKAMSRIVQSGYSRIPVYSGERSNIVALLFVKDLAFVDPDDCIPLLNIIKFYNHPVKKVFHDTTLDTMLEEFKKGTSHLAVVMKVNSSGEGDPVYESIGVVTLEDIIEEIIQTEIVDETDVYVDNVSGQKVANRKQVHQDMHFFLPAPEEDKKKITPQLSFAIFQYLSTAVNAFKAEKLSSTVLRKLIDYPGVYEERIFSKDSQKSTYLYRRNITADYFIIIIQGRVEVTIGVESIIFENGPFSTFGVKAILNDSTEAFLPDYDVKLLTDVQMLKIKKTLYLSALRATILERSKRSPSHYEEFDEVFWKQEKKPENAEINNSNEENTAEHKEPLLKQDQHSLSV